MVETRYKFLRVYGGQIHSENCDTVWTVGDWQSVEGEVKLCRNGFHCSRRMSQAFSYVQGELVAKVEVRGSVASGSDKEAWESQRLVDVRSWRKVDSVALSIFAAELVLSNFESQFPDDDRPRKAIEAAKAWVNEPSTTAAAWAASAAMAHSPTPPAARSAAAAAAWAAWAASATNLSTAAAWAASAVWTAVGDRWPAGPGRAARPAALQDKIANWMEARFETLPIYNSDSVS